MVAVLVAAAVLMAAAGSAKFGSAARQRSVALTDRLRLGTAGRSGLAAWLVGPAEIGAAAAVLFVGGRLAAVAVAVGYAVLAVLAARLARLDAGTDCGCFRRPTPANHWHTGVNALYCAAGLIGIGWPQPSLVRACADHTAAAAGLIAGAVLLAYLSFLAMTALPELLRIRAEVVVR